MRHAAGPGCEQRRRHGDVLGRGAIAIEGREPVHLVAERKALHIVRNLHHDARDLVRRNRRQPIDGPLELVARDRRRMYAYEGFRPSEGGNRHRVDLEPTRFIGAVQAYGPHRARLRPSAIRSMTSHPDSFHRFKESC